MKRLLFLFAIFLLEAAVVHADDQTRNVQTQLKDKGFYYGEVDGKNSSELSAAIRRYQIRNGLEVSGELNKETLDSLGIAGTAVRKAQPVAKRPQPEMQETPEAQANSAPAEEVKPRPPVNLRRSADAQESDVPRPVARGAIPPPAPLDEGNAIAPASPAGPYSDIFAGTPYASAPRIVQESTLRRAQQTLAQRGFYRETITGIPGPAMEEAVLTYQRSARLQLSGRLDLQTLAALHLLPVRAGGSGNPPLRPFYPQGTEMPRQVYRGVWVN